jgi:hypothetical protein
VSESTFCFEFISVLEKIYHGQIASAIMQTRDCPAERQLNGSQQMRP